jgi:hypothetical protein
MIVGGMGDPFGLVDSGTTRTHVTPALRHMRSSELGIDPIAITRERVMRTQEERHARVIQPSFR